MKIFGIGLNRTGTTSLSEALNLLGYQAKHWNDTIHMIDYVDGQWEIDYDQFNKFDAFVDTPIARTYKVLDQHYPGSKFILTTRGINSWLESCKRHFAAKKLKKRSKKNKILNKEIYGVDVFDKKQFIKIYFKHFDNVKEYFKNRKNDLLIIDICRGEGWDELCSFLNEPIPQELFPALNIAKKSLISLIYYKIKRYFYLNR